MSTVLVLYDAYAYVYSYEYGAATQRVPYCTRTGTRTGTRTACSPQPCIRAAFLYSYWYGTNIVRLLYSIVRGMLISAMGYPEFQISCYMQYRQQSSSRAGVMTVRQVRYTRHTTTASSRVCSVPHLRPAAPRAHREDREASPAPLVDWARDVSNTENALRSSETSQVDIAPDRSGGNSLHAVDFACAPCSTHYIASIKHICLPETNRPPQHCPPQLLCTNHFGGKPAGNRCEAVLEVRYPRLSIFPPATG